MSEVRSVLFAATALVLTASVSVAQVAPLSSDTVGPSPQTVAPPGSYAFSVDGDVQLGGFIFKDGYPFVYTNLSASNTAVGLNALISSTPGVPYAKSGRFNTANGLSSLQNNTSGSWNTAIGTHTLGSNTEGGGNTATGSFALAANVSGSSNTASGSYALATNTFGSANTAVGAAALLYNSQGIRNTAVGSNALQDTTLGSWNTAVGTSVLHNNTTGNHNTGVGYAALLSNNGSRNTALGKKAGYVNAAGSDNVWIANFGGAESNTLRIGNGTGSGEFQQTRAFISGIRNATGGGFDQDVCVNSTTDQLGPCDVSSARFKEDIADLDADSEGVFDLRPVRFRYRADFVGEDVERPTRYGLIAEEVARIYPQLVTYDAEGKPMTVRYEALAPLLLNELKKQRAEIERLRGLEARLARLERLEEVRKPRPR